MRLLLVRLAAFARLGRPLFLLGGFTLYGLGAAMAARAGARLDGARAVWGQVAITATQLMTHYANDYFDVEADRANRTPTRWSGGSRVLTAEVLPPWVALGASVALLVAALGAVAVLGFGLRAPALGVAVVLAAIPLAWWYSAPPVRLSARGLGELTTSVVVTMLTPLAGYTLQTGRLEAAAVTPLLPLACLQFAMLLAIELPDAAGDAATGKHTLVVRLGAPAAARLHVGSICAAYAMLPLAGWRPALTAGATAPLAGYQIWRTLRGDYRAPERWERFCFIAVALLMAVSMAELVSFAP
jgi:1,4-dihydroxy-2-naphthoate octaprenyltransferase